MSREWFFAVVLAITPVEIAAAAADAGTSSKDRVLAHRVEIADHPWTPRLRKVNQTPLSQKDRAFDALSLSEKLEFATFYLLESEPPDMHWTIKLWDLQDPDIARTLHDMILREKSDQFAEALMGCATLMVKSATPADYALLKEAAVARTRSIKDNKFKISAEHDVRQMERMYEQTKPDGESH